MAYRPPATPYCGFDRDDDNRRVLAESAAHVLVSGPTGTARRDASWHRRRCCAAARRWWSAAKTTSSNW